MLLKQIHVTMVILTLSSFSIRAYWMYTGSELLHKKAVRIIPHIIDTFLLLSGLAMAIRYYGAFYQHSWLLFKLLGVVIYIILGSVALKRGKTMTVRIAAVVGAWLVFVMIVYVAWDNAVLPFWY